MTYIGYCHKVIECFSLINLVLPNLIQLTHWEVLICKEAKLFMIVRAIRCLIFKSIILKRPCLCVFYVARCNPIYYFFALVCTFGRNMGFCTMICFFVLKNSPTIIGVVQHWRDWLELITTTIHRQTFPCQVVKTHLNFNSHTTHL